MTAQLEVETYRRMVSYLAGQSSLREFRGWFDSSTWDQSQWDSPLIGQIELTLAELSSFKLTEQEFKEALRSSIPTVTLQIEPLAPLNSPTLVTRSASNTTKPLSAFVVRNHPQIIDALLWRPVPA